MRRVGKVDYCAVSGAIVQCVCSIHIRNIINYCLPRLLWPNQVSRRCSVDNLTRFNKIAIQGTPQMAVVDKEAISLSRVYLSRPQVDVTFQRFRFLAPCQRLRAIVCVLSAHLRDDESSTCVCVRLREQFALFTNPPLAGAVSLSVQYWDRECNCCFVFISTKCNGLIFNTEYAT